MATPIIPTGFRFEPTDEELIWYYLYQKTMNFELEWIWIAEKQLYGDNAEPSVVFADVDDSSPYWTTKEEGGVTKRTIYVFTKVTKTSANSKRNSRRAGSGTWMGQTGPKDIIDSRVGNVIGHTRMLTYQKKRNDDPNHWIMHEYTLAGAGLEAERRNDVVLCKITKFIKKSELRRTQVSSFPPCQSETQLLPTLDNMGCEFPAMSKQRYAEEGGEETGLVRRQRVVMESFAKWENAQKMPEIDLTVSTEDMTDDDILYLRRLLDEDEEVTPEIF